MSMLEVKDLVVSYGGIEALKGISFSVDEGQIVTLIGANGAGKSTTLRAITGLVPVKSGSIFYNGEDITRLVTQKTVERGIALVPEGRRVFANLTVLENLSMADNKGKPWDLTRGIQKDRIDFYRTALSQFGLGLENKLNDRVSTLSGGQRQSIALLMSTLTPIRFLILDEHTAALDPKTADLIMRFTDQIVREKKLTALMITHNLNYALQYGNRLLMMHEGKIVLDKKGEEKKKISLQELLDQFDRISIEKGNDI